MKISMNIHVKTVLVIQLQPWLTLYTRVLNKSRNALSENQYGIYLSIYILLFVNWVLYILHKSKTYYNLEYAFTHTFPELSLTSDVPQKPPISYHETTRTCCSHQATRPTEVMMGPGKYWKFQTRGKEGQCLQWQLAAEWPLSALGLYLFSHQPKAFDPSLKSKDRKKDSLLSWWLATYFGWQRTPGHWEALAQDISGPWNDSSHKNWKENYPTSSFRQYTVWSLCRKTTLNRIPLYFSFAGVIFGRGGPYLVIYLFYPCITYILNNAYHAFTYSFNHLSNKSILSTFRESGTVLVL